MAVKTTRTEVELMRKFKKKKKREVLHGDKLLAQLDHRLESSREPVLPVGK